MTWPCDRPAEHLIQEHALYLKPQANGVATASAGFYWHTKRGSGLSALRRLLKLGIQLQLAVVLLLEHISTEVEQPCV